MQTWVQSLGQQDPLKKEMATHSSILVWEVSKTEEPSKPRVHGIAKSQTRLSKHVQTHTHTHTHTHQFLDKVINQAHE